MKYQVEITERADRDLRNILLYITFDLMSPVATTQQFNQLWDAILSLDEFPERHPLYPKEPWHGRGLRIFPVNNYKILYIAYPKESVVRVVTVMYSGRNISLQLPSD